jgi:hypothetical protein
VLVNDEQYAPLYKDSPKGRPSIPPSMIVLAMLLQYHDDCSNVEAEVRMRFELRWKHALGSGWRTRGSMLPLCAVFAVGCWIGDSNAPCSSDW